jgi:transcriptional regulator with XRE-family HTH domain
MSDTVGVRIESIAAKNGLPGGVQLAKLLGVTYESLRKWREGESAPNRKRQQVVAKVLGVQPEEFMYGGADGAVASDFNARFSLAALELAERFDAVPAGRKRRLYAVLLDEIRQACEPSFASKPKPDETPSEVQPPHAQKAHDRSRA